MDEQELLEIKELQNDPWVGSFYPFANEIWWPDIIRWFVTIKCWIIVIYSKVWSAEITNHVVEWVMDIIGNFLVEVMVDSRGNLLS
jgi:hypothetical protein